MPRIDPGYNQPKRRRRPQRTGAVGKGADTTSRPASTPAPTRPASTPTTPAERKRAPAFRPVRSQATPFKPQKTRAAAQTKKAASRIGDGQDHGLRDQPQKPDPVFKIDPNQIGKSPAFRPIGSQVEEKPGQPVQASPFRVAQSRTAREARAARNKLPDHPDIPEVKGLYLQTDLDRVEDIYKKARLAAARATTQTHVDRIQKDYEREAKKILDKTPDELIARVRGAYKDAAHKLGHTAISDLYTYGSLRQRRQLKKVGRIVGDYERSVAEQNAANSGIPAFSQQAKPVTPRTTAGMNPVEASLLPIDKLTAPIGKFLDEHTRIPDHRDASLFDLANIVPQLGRATVEDPEAVLKSSVRTGLESVAGIPEGIKQLISNPTGSLGEMAKDYERRYGPIFNDPELFRQRVKEESGLTPFVFDAASLGVPVGRAATVLLRSGPAGRAIAALGRVADEHGTLRPLSDLADASHRAARAPRDARKLRNLQSELNKAELDGDVARQAELHKQITNASANVKATERPALRFGAGEAGVRKQASSPNLFIGLGQRALDKSRRGAYAKTVEASGHELGPGGRLIAPDDVTPTRLTAFRPGDREVVPKTTGVIGRSGRELPGLRKYTGRAARDLGGEQSVTRVRMLTHRGRVLHAIDKQLRKLDPDESDSVKYMLQLGATPDEAGINILKERRAQITAARTEHGTEITPILRSTNDELRVIDKILADPARHLTPKAREVSDELRAIQLREAERDPELSSDQELIRRMTPQGEALGVTRGPDADFFRGVLGEIEAMRVDRHGTPTAPGVAAYADELADLHPSERGARARELVKAAKKDRKAAERNVSTDERRLARADELIKTQERRGRVYEDEPVRHARGTLQALKRRRRALTNTIARAERRAGRSEGRLSEREAKGAPLVTEPVRDARKAVSAAQRHVNALQGRIGREERRAGRRQGEATIRGGTPARDGRALNAELGLHETKQALAQARTDLQAAQAHLRDVERDAPRLTAGQRRGALATEIHPDDLRHDLADLDEQIAAARGGLDQAIAEAPRVTPSQVEARLRRERELNASRATRDHIKNFEKALKQVERASKHKANMKLEDATVFADRVRQAAEDFGLDGPAYWWSSAMPEQLPSLAAAGRGVRAAHANKAYTGGTFRIGAEETSTDVFTRGVERNIKRRFQQALVVRNMETYAYEWSKGHQGAGLTISEIRDEMARRAIDPDTIELVDPRILKKRYSEAEGVERGDVVKPGDVAGRTEDDFVTTTQQDFAAGRRQWKDVEHDDRLTQGQHRYLAVPREVGETLDGLASHMDNKFWRSMEIVLKQKPARILLGAANVPWLAFQVASNALLTGIGGGVNPFNITGAHRWFKGLTDVQRDAVEAELGITHGHHFGMDQPHLGASNNRIVNFWRGYKTSQLGRAGTRINPLNIMFRADEAQNNFFRKMLFYDKARKQAYRNMGHSWKGIDKATTRLVDRVFALPPERQAAAIAQHGEDFERVAKHVNDFLGDYLRFTPSERFLLSRNVMFYGYLRFSLRFTFYTMPIAHPIMANIAGNIGRMGAQEIKNLFGVGRNYSLPTSMLANTYFGNRKDAVNGDLKSLPLGRFNPFLNALTQLDGLQQAVGLVSPFYQALADQAFEESSFTGRDWRIGGRPTPSASTMPKNYYGSTLNLLNPGAYDIPGHEGKPRNRIIENSILNLAYPYRVAAKTGIPGLVDPLETSQSDDSLLWRPKPMQYADPGAKKGLAKSRRDQRKKGVLRTLGGALLPVIPDRTSSPAVVQREIENEEAIRERNKRAPGVAKKRKRRRRKKTSNRYGGGSGRYG